MKTVLPALICSFFLSQLFAFNSKTTVEDQIENIHHQIAKQFASNKSTLLLNKNVRLNLLQSRLNDNGSKTFKYKQFYNQIPIEGADYVIRANNNNIINVSGKLMKLNNISTKPALFPEVALSLTTKKLNHKTYAWQNHQYQQLIKKIKRDNSATFFPKVELVLIDSSFQNNSENLKLAYKMDIYSIEPLSRQIVYIDAHTGDIIKSIEKIHRCTPEKINCSSNYSGMVEIDVCLENGEFILKNEIGGGMQVYNANNTKENPNTIVTDEGVNFQNDPTAIDVHYGTQQVDAYFKSIHQHNGIDNNNMPYLSWVHFGENFNHAFWNGNWMTYGDGDNINYKPLTSIDMVAHEIVHGIIDFSSELIYLNETGALNESFADFFGEVIEAWAYGSNDWILGAELVIADAKSGIRNLSNPKDMEMMQQQPDTYKGDLWYEGYNDHGGVHINSGVHNYMFYLLTEGGFGINDHGYSYSIAGLGMDKVAEMAYECMTILPSNANFQNARNNFIQIATGLYGEESNEVEQVKEAYAAVGVYSCQERDRAALVGLYNALDGPNWVNKWDTITDYKQWYGVKVNEFGCVTCLDLDGIENFQHDPDSIPNGNGLAGELPAEIGLLRSLDSLILSNNNLTGDIPSAIGQLDSLQHIWIDFNEQLDGAIPTTIGNLENLITIFFYGNNLSGSIPASIGNLKKLEYLFLGMNNLEGEIPAEIGNLFNLIKLDLADNNLTGKIPATFTNLTLMIEWWINGNQLSGCFHNDLKNLCTSPFDPSVENNFAFSWRQFCDEDLGICSPSNSKDSLTLIKIWEATGGENWDNPWSLTSSYKDWYGIYTDTDGNVTGIDLDGNDDGTYTPNAGGVNLTGFIPPEIGRLLSLEFIYFSGNSLTGIIPKEISSLKALQNLVLSDNLLTGEIPYEFSELTNLTELRLDNNNLSGCFYESLDTLCALINIISIDENNDFEVLWNEFCNNNQGYCGGEFVLPGDFNADSIITAIDMLYWGNAYGSSGVERMDATNLFIPQYAENWESATDGINDKHKDADGNGIIDDADVLIFKNNIDESNQTFENEEIKYTDSQVSISLVPVDVISESDKIRVVYDIKIARSDGTPFNFYGYSCEICFGDTKLYDAELQVNANSSINVQHYQNLDNERNCFDFVITQTSFDNTTPIQVGTKIIVLIEDILDSMLKEDIAVSFASVGKNGIDYSINQIIPVSTSSSLQINKGNLNATVSIIHKQKTNSARISIRAAGGTGNYIFNTKGLAINQVTNDSIVIDSLKEGRYLIDIVDENKNLITVPIYIDGPNGDCKYGIDLSTPVLIDKSTTKITWSDNIALLQYKNTDTLSSWITVQDYDGETLLSLPKGQYHIRSKYPCVNGDIYSDVLVIDVILQESMKCKDLFINPTNTNNKLIIACKNKWKTCTNYSTPCKQVIHSIDQVIIYNTLGTIVKHVPIQNFNNSKIVLDIGSLEKGLYVWTALTNDDQLYTKRFIKL